MTTATRSSERDDQLMLDFPAIMAKWELPGLAIGTLIDGEISIQTAGLASLSTKAPVTPDTIFGIGSISKVFTATLAMALVEAGKLDLDAPIAGYYPALALADPQARATLTMRHLLTHQGGFEGDGFKDKGNDDEALGVFVSEFDKLEQVSLPGEYWSYSNNGFGLAGAVLAHVSGESYEDAMRRYVLAPLGMTRTGFGQPPVLPDTAHGYDFGAKGDREERDPGGVTRSANPAGGMMSTVGDLLRFAHMHLGILPDGVTPIFPEPTRQAMQATQVVVNSAEEWGIGWEKRRLVGNSWMVEHGGWYNGFRAQLTLLPDRQAAIAILTNGPLGHAAIEEMQKELLDKQFSTREADRTPVELAPDLANRYLGHYVQSHMDVKITDGDDTHPLVMHLKTEWHGEENDKPLVCPLIAISEQEFVIDGGEFDGSRIVFFLDDNGTVTFVRVLSRLCRPVEIS